MVLQCYVWVKLGRDQAFFVCHCFFKIYHMAGNIGGNYIVQFHEKITGFLLAELNIAF